jgi:hypothetical protein
MECQFRLCADGTATLRGSKRRLTGTLEDVLLMLREHHPFTEKFSPVVQDGVKGSGDGSYLFIADPGEAGALRQTLYLPVWKSPTNISLLLDKLECAALLNRLTGETMDRVATLEKHMKGGDVESTDVVEEETKKVQEE